ncbi:MAG: hypothetical protein LBS17_02550 [Actinomycetes bacterium]|jgi:tetratricopeptide (TPR) repeat protein|nr:hypothetical protein [Actinomycetes bacterium]
MQEGVFQHLGNITRAMDARQRRMALVAAGCFIVLLAAAIVFVVLQTTGVLHPTPTNEAQLAYTRAVTAEAEAVRIAKANGIDPASDSAVIAARADLALAEIDLGQARSALDRIKPLAHADANNARVRYVYGLALQETGSKRAATDEFAAAAELAPDTEPELRRQALAAWGRRLADQGEETQALDKLTQAALVGPTSAALAREAADFARELDDWQQAAYLYTLAAAFQPDDNTVTDALADITSKHPADAAAGAAAARQLLGDAMGPAGTVTDD